MSLVHPLGTTSFLSNISGRTIAAIATAAVLLLAAASVIVAAYAANDQNDTNNLRCTGDPHDPKDSGNAHEPPNESGNPHFCPSSVVKKLQQQW